MACSSISLAGIGLGCKDSMGGIKEVYIIKENDVTNITIEENIITAIETSTSAKFKTYKFRKGTSSMSTSLTTDEAAGTLSFQTDLALQFTKMETAKRLEIMALAVDSVVVIVLDSNGHYWYLGKDFPVTASSATANSGTAFGDFSGYNITLTDNSRELPYEVEASIVSALIDEAPNA